MLPATQTIANETPEQEAPNQPTQPVQPQVPPVQPPVQPPVSPTFNVDPTATKEPVVFNVDPSPQSNPPNISPETVEKRSFKFKYGLDEILKKSKDEIYKTIQDGGEQNLREIAASEIDKRKFDETAKAITQLAANKGAPLTPEESAGVSQIMQRMNKSTDPQSVLEEAYGKQFIATLDRTATNRPDSFYNDAKKAIPEPVAEVTEKASTLLTKRTFAETLHENVLDEAKHQGWVPWLADQAKSLVPGYEDIKLRGNVEGVGVFSGIGLGSNLDEQRKALLRLPFDEYKTQLTAVVNHLRKDNPTVAAAFLESVLGTSSDDSFINDMMLPISLVGTGIGSATGKAIKVAVLGVSESQLLKDSAKAAVDMVKAGAGKNVSKSTVEAAAGDLKEAAVTKATANTIGDIHGVPEATKRGVEALTETHRVDQAGIASGPGRFGQDMVNRIGESANNRLTQLMDVAVNVSKTESLPEVMAVETAVRAIIDNMKNTYRGLKNAVIDTSRPYKEALTGNWLADIRLGNNDGTYFTNRNVAEKFIEFHGLGDATVEKGINPALTKSAKAEAQLNKNIADAERTIPKIEERLKGDLTEEQRAKELSTLNFLRDEAIPGFKAKLAERGQKATVEQQGLGFYVRVTKPIPVTDPVIRSLIAETKNTQIPNSALQQFFNSWAGKIRTAEEVLSKADRQNRLIATYAPSEVIKVLQSNMKEIQALSSGRFSKGRQRWEEWKAVLQNAQELPDKTDLTGKKMGHFFESPEELEHYYQQWVHRLPDEQETAAYFEFKYHMEADRILRNIVEHRNQQRVGSETHKITTRDIDGKPLASDEFSGITRKSLGGSEDNIVIMGDRAGEERIVNVSKGLTTAEKEEINEGIKRGEHKLIEVYNPELNPLNGFGKVTNERVRFVLAKTSESRELDWNQIPRRGGGHLEYDYEHYIKQATMHYDDVGKKYWYHGDTTLMAVPIRRMGEEVAKHLNVVRELLKETKEEAARAYSNQNLHIDWDTVNGWFKAGPDANGKFQAARLSYDEPIQVVAKGKSINRIDKDLEKRYANFKDGTREGSLARQNQTQYAQERDAGRLMALDDTGQAGSPLYSMSPAKTIDPITTMNRGLSNIVRSNFMDDYKNMAVEHWLKQAGKFLDANDSQIRHSPFYYYNEAKFRSNTPQEIKDQFMAAKYHIDQLVGQPSETQGRLHRLAQNMSDNLYGKFGPKAAVITPSWLLHTLSDPYQFIRSVVFEQKMGLFNLPQFIVQANNYTNIYGIAGSKFATPGTYAAQLHFWSTVNSHPNIIDHLDLMATKLRIPFTANWRPGEFKEALQELHYTGFGNAGGEYAAVDNPTSAKLITHMGNKFLDWGRYPFKKGEENARYGAWYTAYKEFRELKPTGRITPEDRASILQRADLLNINMSRASASALHKGIASIPTQFATYQIRLAELFTGSRLTGIEKARMVATNAALYGVPMGVGLTGLPIADYLRQKALEHGYVVGSNPALSALMEGGLSALGAAITGGGDMQKGTWFDVGPRMGTKGFEFLGGINKSDKSILDYAGGAAWSVMKNTWEQSDGFRRAMISLGKQDGDAFPLVAEDLVDPLKEITSINTAWRTIAAVNTGKWLSKKDVTLATTSTGNALFAAISGLKDQRIDDIQTMSASLRDRANYEKEVEKQFQQEFQRAVNAHRDNPELAHKFFVRAAAWLAIGGYREDRIGSIVSKAVNNNKALIDKINWDFYIKKAPDASKLTLQEGMKKTQQIKQLRGEK